MMSNGIAQVSGTALAAEGACYWSGNSTFGPETAVRPKAPGNSAGESETRRVLELLDHSHLIGAKHGVARAILHAVSRLISTQFQSVHTIVNAARKSAHATIRVHGTAQVSPPCSRINCNRGPQRRSSSRVSPEFEQLDGGATVEDHRDENTF